MKIGQQETVDAITQIVDNETRLTHDEMQRERMRMNRRKRLTFWGADEDDDSLPRAVMDGRKTVTADTVAEYYKQSGEYGDGSYAPGDIIEVYDLKQRLRCIIKATKVDTIKFGNIPDEVWRGETFSSAEEFREVHIRCMPHEDLHD
ncbi:ASCH domain-containing protein, partial [Paraburkholderia bryophila]|uniref:ASCH domain-containing protein n=1 Tax=Paraburkholderia bryophila TaxID=420952 RepID=UPI0038B886EF